MTATVIVTVTRAAGEPVTQPPTAPAGRTILVTGAAGLLGRATVAELRRLGAAVVPVVRRVDPAASADAVAVDLSGDAAALVAGVDARVDVIVHLAAVVPRADGSADDETAAALTRAIDGAVARAAQTWDVPVIYASGCALYARDPGYAAESAPLAAPRSPYLQAKLDGDIAFASVARNCVLRISSIYGAGMPQDRVLPRFVAAALARRPITLWGTGSREQDFVAARDVAHAIGLAAAARRAGVFNVAAGRPVTMEALAALVTAITANPAGYRFAGQPDPQDGAPARYGIEAIARALGWTPTITLRDGVAEMVAALAERRS